MAATNNEVKIAISAVDTTSAAFESAKKHLGSLGEIAQGMAGKIGGIGLVSLGLGAAIGASMATFKAKISDAIDGDAGLKTLAERIGSTVESVSRLGPILKGAGTDTETFAGGMQKLSKAMIDAQNGGSKTTASFSAIGISMDDIKGKKPDEVFELIARSLANYKDGSEKVVIAQNLLGKSGANLLPAMKDLAEVGDLQAKATTEQGNAADELQKTQARLQASSGALYKMIGRELVPVMNAFYGAVLDAQNGNNGLKKSIGDLAKDDSIRSWAEGAAKVVGFVIDAFDGVVRTMQLAGLRLGALAAQGVAVVKGEWGQVKVIEKEVLADMDAIMQKTLFSDRLQQRIAESRQKAAPIEKKKELDVSGLGNDNAPKQSAPNHFAANLINQLTTEYANLHGEMSKTAEITRKLDTATEKFTPTQRAQALTLAGQIDAHKNLKFTLDAEIKAMQERDTQMEAAQALYAANMRALATTVRDQEFEATLLGKTAEAVEKLRFERALSLQISQAEAQVYEQQTNGLLSQIEARQRLNALTSRRDQITAGNDVLVNDRKDQAYNPARGMSDAIKDYQETIAKAGDAAKSATSKTLQSMEDALTSFALTGKLSVKNLVDNMISEFLRLQVIRPLMASLFSPGSAGTSFLGGIFGGFTKLINGSHANGLDYVPFDGYIAQLHKGERVLTAAENKAGGAGQTIHITMAPVIGNIASKDDVVRGMQIAVNQTLAKLQRAGAYGGSAA